MANEPNFYQVHGHVHGGQLTVTYSTSGFDGKPHFTYQDAFLTLQFTGNEITRESTELGTLVSVFIVRTIDAGSTTFTLLVPRVNLDQGHHAPIETEGITTVHRFSIFPQADHGQTDLYSVTRLTGTARLVEFFIAPAGVSQPG